MITWVTNQLAYGDMEACHLEGTHAVIHACKHPCWSGAVEQHEQGVLALERNKHLYLNMIDPDRPLFHPKLFVSSMDFIDRHLGSKVIVHCNMGLSRSPSIILVYLAKRLKAIVGCDYVAAATMFRAQFPYRPSRGIAMWLTRHWHEI